jgi:peptide/nickel transport system permease protein
VFLFATILLAAGADFFATYDPAEQHRDRPFAKPFWLSGDTASGHWLSSDQHGQVRVFAPTAGAPTFLLGADEFGRDIWSRLVRGGRISLGGGLLATLLAVLTGLLLGATSGLTGGWTDRALMGSTELMMSLPWLYLLLALRAVLPLSMSQELTFLLTCGLMGLAGAARPARTLRGVAWSAAQSGYVGAARRFGASRWYLIRRHVAPDLASTALTQASLLFPGFVLAEVTLSFLGLGVGEPVPSWGGLLAYLGHTSVIMDRWWLALPALWFALFFASLYSLTNTFSGRWAGERM